MAEVAINLDTVLQALRALYHSPQQREKDAASAWLEQFQKSVYAWTISDQLLAQKHDLESCYFAAQTMRTKIQHHFHELPMDSHASLRDSLLNHLASCDTNTNAVVITQLCLALADLALLMATWNDAVSDFLRKFAPCETSYPVLLELLTVIPEEMDSRQLRLGKNRRNDLLQQYTLSFAGVHQFLTACLTTYQSDTNKLCKIIKCLTSWFNLGVVTEEIIIRSNVLQAVFHCIAAPASDCSSQLHEAAADCLCAALFKCEDLGRYGTLAQMLYEAIISLFEQYKISAHNQDTDRCLNFTRIFTEMSESFITNLIHSPNKGLGNFTQLDILCATLDYEEYEVAEISFNFWYSLSQQIDYRRDSSLNEMFSPYVRRVILSLTKHIELSSDQEGLLSETDDFYDFRDRSKDVLKDIVFIIKPKICAAEMLSILQQPNLTWTRCEAALFSTSAVAEYINSSEDTVIQEVLNLIITQCCNPLGKLHTCVDYTSIVLIGELCEWIEKHTSHLEPILQFLLSCMHSSQLASAAAASLEKICDSCAEQKQMIENLNTMFQIVQHVDSFNISSNATVKLIKGASTILSKFPADQVAVGVQQLCTFQLEPLIELMNSSGDTVNIKLKRGTHSNPGFWVDRLTSVIRYGIPQHKNGTHPCFNVINSLWPTLSAVCTKYNYDPKTAEKCCRCVRFFVRNLGRSFTPLLQSLVQTIIKLYTDKPHSCYLYLSSILVDEYAEIPGCLQGLMEMCEQMAPITFNLLAQENGLVNNPDVIDDFFRLCLRFLQKGRLVFLNSSIADNVLKCAIAATSIMHREANESVMTFLIRFLEVQVKSTSSESRVEYEQVHKLLETHGQPLVDAVVKCVVSELPPYLMEDLSEVMLSLLTFDRSVTSTNLQQTLNNLPRQSAGGSVTATPQQIADFYSGVIKATDPNDIRHLFKDFLRLFR